MLLEFAALILSAAILLHSVFRLLHFCRSETWFQRSSIPILLNLVAWIVLAIVLLIFWPEALQPILYPRRSFLFFAVMTFYFYAAAEEFTRNTPRHNVVKIAGKALLAALMCASLFLALRYMNVIRPRIEGVDFYYYVSIARDLVAGIKNLTPFRYSYFPGVYLFWKIPFAFGYGSLSILQWWYLALIVSNCIALFAVIQRVTSNLYASFFSVLWYVHFCSRLEGFCGSTEPLITLPLLLGILIWGGKSFLGRTGLVRTFALGAGLGLALVAKQQGGLLSLGALSFIPLYFTQKEAKFVSVQRLLLLPIFACSIFVIGILLDGHGFEPLIRGLTLMRSYGSEVHHPWTTFIAETDLTWPLVPMGFTAFLFWVFSLTVKGADNLLHHGWFAVLGFTSIAGIAGYIPFLSRAYGHYGLLPAPMLIIAGAITIVEVCRFIAVRYQLQPLIRFALIVVLLYPFIQTDPSSRLFFLWPVDRIILPPQPQSWARIPAVARDLDYLKTFVQRGENVLVLPPRRYEPHFYLGSYCGITRLGYPWSNPIPLGEVINSTKLDAVITVNSNFQEPGDVIMCNLMHCETAEAVLKKTNFNPVLVLPTMSLWRGAETR